MTAISLDRSTAPKPEPLTQMTIANQMAKIQTTFSEYQHTPDTDTQIRDGLRNTITMDFLELERLESCFNDFYHTPSYYSRHMEDLNHDYSRIIGGTPEGNKNLL